MPESRAPSVLSRGLFEFRNPEGTDLLARCAPLADWVDASRAEDLSFSKTFACLGGFVATRARGASYYVRGFSGTYTFSNYLIPAQVAAVRAALAIVTSTEGSALRAETLVRSQTLRDAIECEGLDVGGRLSPLVLPRIGAEAVARLAQRRCFEHGVIVNSIEFPACRKGEARFRLQVTPKHDQQELRHAAAVIGDAVRWGRAQVEPDDASSGDAWA